MRRSLAVAVFVGLTALEVTAMIFVDTSTMPIARAGGSFHVGDVAAGTVFTQRLEVRANGLNEVRLKGSMSRGERPAVLRAQLVETDPQGVMIRVVRTGQVTVPADGTDCCAFRFEPVDDSRWRSYRFDLRVETVGDRRLSLPLVPEESNANLTINGRPRYASLVFRTFAAAGTGAGRLGSESGRVVIVVLLALLYNAAFAVSVSLIASASGLRHV